MQSAGGRSGAAPAAEGRTRDLRGATVTTTGYVNGVPRTQLELLHGLERVPLGSGARRHGIASFRNYAPGTFLQVPPCCQGWPKEGLIILNEGSLDYCRCLYRSATPMVS